MIDTEFSLNVLIIMNLISLKLIDVFKSWPQLSLLLHKVFRRNKTNYFLEGKKKKEAFDQLSYFSKHKCFLVSRRKMVLFSFSGRIVLRGKRFLG